MSASSKKKLRREQNAAELTEKQLTEQKEAKKLKAQSTAFVAVIAVIVCIALAVGLSNLYSRSGISERNTVAATVGERELSTAELSYYYIDAINTTYNNWYNSYGDYTSTYVQMLMGLDMTQPLSDQPYMGDESKTWADYFVEIAVENAKSVYAMYDLAVADGRTLTEEEEESIDNNIATMEMYGTVYGYPDIESYLKANYGNGATEGDYREYLKLTTLAAGYYADYADSLVYDDAALRAYEEGREKEYNSYTFASYYLAANRFLEGGTTDDEGNTTYSDEETAASIAAAKKAAESLSDVKTVEELETAAAALPVNADTTVSVSKNTDLLYSDITSTLQSWVSDESRKAGDVAVIPNESTSTGEDGEEKTTTFGYYVVIFQDSTDNAFPLVNVRHILSSFEGGTTDETTGLTTYSDTEKKAALDALTAVEQTWKDGEATEDSFAALVADNSDDTGSLTTGGLYEDVYPGQMVTAFNDWCFDASRKPGDTDIVETEYGYHFMYFVGNSDQTYRDHMLTADKHAEDLDSWYTGIVDAATASAEDVSGLNLDLIMTPAA